MLAMEEEEGGLTGQSFQEKKASTRDSLIAVRELYNLKKQNTSVKEEKSCPTASGTPQGMVCSRFFRGNGHLLQHMRTHIGDRPYQCSICTRSFTSRDILMKHLYIHKEQPFKCGKCGQLFKRLAHLQEHFLNHSQERTYQCSVCDKSFRTQNSLTDHMWTHFGMNWYKCHVCSQHFQECGSLQRHTRLHTEERPYKCPLCKKVFTQRAALSVHLKNKGRVVANTQQYIPAADASTQYIQQVGDSQQLMLQSVQEVTEGYAVLDITDKHTEGMIENVEVITAEELPQTERPDYYNGHETETLQIVDSDTGEPVIIMADKSIVDLIKEQQFLLKSGKTRSSLQKIKEILHTAGNVTSVFKNKLSIEFELLTLDAEMPEQDSDTSQRPTDCTTTTIAAQ